MFTVPLISGDLMGREDDQEDDQVEEQKKILVRSWSKCSGVGPWHVLVQQFVAWSQTWHVLVFRDVESPAMPLQACLQYELEIYFPTRKDLAVWFFTQELGKQLVVVCFTWVISHEWLVYNSCLGL